jgi:hypothetical protein
MGKEGESVGREERRTKRTRVRYGMRGDCRAEETGRLGLREGEGKVGISLAITTQG